MTFVPFFFFLENKLVLITLEMMWVRGYWLPIEPSLTGRCDFIFQSLLYFDFLDTGDLFNFFLNPLDTNSIITDGFLIF